MLRVRRVRALPLRYSSPCVCNAHFRTTCRCCGRVRLWLPEPPPHAGFMLAHVVSCITRSFGRIIRYVVSCALRECANMFTNHQQPHSLIRSTSSFGSFSPVPCYYLLHFLLAAQHNRATVRFSVCSSSVSRHHNGRSRKQH